MKENKLIPCRVCGKPFKPCGYCQSHLDTFKWRNFACSRECAEKYISETIAYRNSSKEYNNVIDNVVTVESSIVIIESNEEQNNTTKRKYNKRKSTNDVETINEERGQID
jgi:hypothetical protein